MRRPVRQGEGDVLGTRRRVQAAAPGGDGDELTPAGGVNRATPAFKQRRSGPGRNGLPIGPWMVGPMPAWIAALADDRVGVPAVEGAHVGAEVAQCQSAASLGGAVRFRGMQEPVAVQRNLTRLHRQRHRGVAVARRIPHRLPEHVVLACVRIEERHLRIDVRTGGSPASRRSLRWRRRWRAIC